MRPGPHDEGTAGQQPTHSTHPLACSARARPLVYFWASAGPHWLRIQSGGEPRAQPTRALRHLLVGSLTSKLLPSERASIDPPLSRVAASARPERSRAIESCRSSNAVSPCMTPGLPSPVCTPDGGRTEHRAYLHVCSLLAPLHRSAPLRTDRSISEHVFRGSSSSPIERTKTSIVLSCCLSQVPPHRRP